MIPDEPEGGNMGIVYQTDKRSGITYAYESHAYWDKEKKQSRAHRTLIGRLDKETGKIVPTDGRGRKRRKNDSELIRKKQVPVQKVTRRFHWQATGHYRGFEDVFPRDLSTDIVACVLPDP